MKNYFEFFEIPISFGIDEADIKKKFYQNSKSFHPDLHAQASFADQDAMLKMSTFNNLAYKTLSNDDRRLAYILELFGKIGKEIKPIMPQMFLMEMMDINEQVMDIKMEYSTTAHEKLKIDIEEAIQSLDAEVADFIHSSEQITENDTNLNLALDYYLKKKYLKRLKANSEGLEVEI